MFGFRNWDFPGGPVIKNPPSNAEDMGLIPGLGTKPAWGDCATTQEKPVCCNSDLTQPKINR